MLKVDIQSFGYTNKEILKDIVFELNTAEHLAILGESGGGKSTILHLIYGLIELKKGEMSYKDKKLLGPNHKLIPGEEFIKLVAQEFNVMPYTTVAENVASHLNRQNEKSDQERVDELLLVLELTEFKNVLVKNLSGGQKQRVAIATALAKEPELLLLDEPFSHIDTFRKNNLRRRLYTYLKKQSIGCITATHDSQEAMMFSDRILILKNGTIETCGSPEEVYNSATTAFQAGFFSEFSIIPSQLLDGDKTPETILLYPHQLKLADAPTGLEVSVIKSYFKGRTYLIQAKWENVNVYFEHFEPLKTRDMVYLERYEND